MLDQVSTSSHRVWLDAGIVRVESLPGAEQTRADAVETVALLWEVAGRRRRPVLVDLRQVKSVDRGARAYYTGPATAGVSSATGLLVGSPLTRILANFLIGFQTSPSPARMFSAESEALAWLQTFVESP